MAPKAILGLNRPATRRRRLRKHASDQKEGLQWTIDGRPLSSILEEAGQTSEAGHKAQSDLCFSVVQERQDSYAEEGRNAIKFLLGEGTWDELPNRVPLLVGECLDIGCGVITASVGRTENIVIWDDFRVHGPGPEEHGHSFRTDLSFTFDRKQHDTILRSVLGGL